MYADGQPLIIDAGVEKYTKKTFGKNLYYNWNLQSAYHNLPTINGYMQKDGKECRSKDVIPIVKSNFSKFYINLSNAYPAEAGIKYWKKRNRVTFRKQILRKRNFRFRFQKRHHISYINGLSRRKN